MSMEEEEEQNLMKMLMEEEEEEESQDMDEDRQNPIYSMPKRLKNVERDLKEMPGIESLNYGQQIQKVPPVLRLENKSMNDSSDYDPIVVALGPYHHGKERLQSAEAFKSKALQHIIVDTGKSVQVFFDKVFDRVNDVRSFYAEDSTKNYSDSRFAQMMLLDACFIISYIQSLKNPNFASIILGEFGGYSAIQRDLFLLENQIPLWFLQLMMYLAYGGEADGLLDDFIYKFSDFSRSKRNQIASYYLDSHLLDACRRVLLSECNENKPFIRPCCKFRFVWHIWTYVFGRLMIREFKKKYIDDYIWEQSVPSFYSASDLKAKGIHLKPSRSHSLTGICFKSNYCYPQLQPPILHVSSHTKVFFSNLIVYESCLMSATEQNVTAYINFMKSLILHADDVNVLREKGILFTSLSRDEVVQMFKELNTSVLSTERTMENTSVLCTERPTEKAWIEIRKYIRSNFKSWLGEFLYTYFGSPWTAIGTIAAIILLVLTLAQTYFTIWGSYKF